MSKKKALKVRFRGQREDRYSDCFEWEVGGNDTRTLRYRWYSSGKRDVIEASRWNPWSRRHHPISALFRDAQRKGIPVDHKSGKKEKKFWRKVMRRIKSLAP